MALVVGICLCWTLLHHGVYTHWLTITLVLVMQPFFATTWQRTLERVGGTLLGGVVAAGLSALLHTRLYLAALLPLLGGVALAVRQVSYGVYIAVYTPVVILLVEQIRPLDDQLGIALARAGYTIAGGLIAVAANCRALAGLAARAGAARPRHLHRRPCRLRPPRAATGTGRAGRQCGRPGARRRQAGLASNNLEASLQRAMHEPRRGQRDRLQAVLVADATLRRIAARLTAISLAPVSPSIGQAGPDPARLWIVAALQAFVAGAPLPDRLPAPAESDGLNRLVRQVELLDFTLSRMRLADGTSA